MHGCSHRGWVNADALQPLAERGAPGLVAETGTAIEMFYGEY